MRYRSKWIPKKFVGQFQIYPKIEICIRVPFYLDSIWGFQKRPCALWRLRTALPGALREPAGDSARHWMGNEWKKPIFDLIEGEFFMVISTYVMGYSGVMYFLVFYLAYFLVYSLKEIFFLNVFWFTFDIYFGISLYILFGRFFWYIIC